MRKTGKILLILILIFILGGCTKKLKLDKKHYKIITTDFVAYDFTKGITNGASNIELSMLFKPGSDLHNVKLSSKNIEDIKKCDMFIYNEDEKEVLRDILKEIDDNKTKVINLKDLANDKEEVKQANIKVLDDNHIWMSPKRGIIISKGLKKEILKMTNDKEVDIINENTRKYLLQLENLDKELSEIIKNAKRKNLALGDSFVFAYLASDYGLNFFYLDETCSSEKEISEDQVNDLIKKIKENNISTLYYTERANQKIVQQIESETKVKLRELHSVHNIAINDFNKGITYNDIMKKNIKLIYEGLN